MPQRIQRKRTKGWTMPEGAVYVRSADEVGQPVSVVRLPGVADLHFDRRRGVRHPVLGGTAEILGSYRLPLPVSGGSGEGCRSGRLAVDRDDPSGTGWPRPRVLVSSRSPLPCRRPAPPRQRGAVMTLSIPVSCSSCPEVLRVPLTAFDLPEGRYLGVDARDLLKHVAMHEEAR